MLHFKMHLRFHFKNHEKLLKECEERYAFDVVVDSPLDGATKGAPFNTKLESLRVFISYIVQNKQNCRHFQIKVY